MQVPCDAARSSSWIVTIFFNKAIRLLGTRLFFHLPEQELVRLGKLLCPFRHAELKLIMRGQESFFRPAASVKSLTRT